MDKSWMGTERIKKPYIDGVASFIEYAVSNLKISKNKKITCPCIKCVNHISGLVDDVEYHLLRYGIDQTYTNWINHGEKEEPPLNVYYEDSGNAMHTSDFFESTTGFPTDATDTVDMVEATKENFIGEHEKFKKLLEDAEKPLYLGCPDFTKLSAIVQLLNLKSKYGISDKCFTDTLVLFKKMLPEGNELVSSTYEAKKAMKAMGSGYTKIHACKNDCILYRNEYTHVNECPTCGKSRWKVDEVKNKIYENIPAKVLWYFPIIPRLK